MKGNESERTDEAIDEMVSKEKCLTKTAELQNRKPSQQVDVGETSVLKNRFDWWSVVSAASIIIATGLGTLVARKAWRM